MSEKEVTIGITSEMFADYSEKVLRQYPDAVAHRSEFDCKWTINHLGNDSFVVAKLEPKLTWNLTERKNKLAPKWQRKASNHPRPEIQKRIPDYTRYNFTLHHGYNVGG